MTLTLASLGEVGVKAHGAFLQRVQSVRVPLLAPLGAARGISKKEAEAGKRK